MDVAVSSLLLSFVVFVCARALVSVCDTCSRTADVYREYTKLFKEFTIVSNAWRS